MSYRQNSPGAHKACDPCGKKTGWRTCRVQDCPTHKAAIDLAAARLTSMGYRRVSNRYRRVARITTPNWKEDGVSAHEMRLKVKFPLVLPPDLYNMIPRSEGDDTGYMPIHRCYHCRDEWGPNGVTFVEVKPGVAEPVCHSCQKT